MQAKANEINFDGLPGPTHNYGGLSVGNLASTQNSGKISNPQAAALQGLEKMRLLQSLGLRQGILPPHERPFLPALRQFGFSGTDEDIVALAGKVAPALLANTSSAAAMWTANAATVSPSADTNDTRVHFTPANLGSMYHRSLEPETTGRILKTIFSNKEYFSHHAPVFYGGAMGDEGAANHGRFSNSHGEQGVELFVYGRSAFETLNKDYHFPPRQAMETSHAIATTHQLKGGSVVFTRQSMAAINAGAFHNDVVSVTNGNVLFYHEQAFDNKTQCLEMISTACARLDIEPHFIEVPSDKVSLQDAISSYLFNSQLVTLPEGGMALILPKDAESNPRTNLFVQSMLADNRPIHTAHFLDLKQSMRNGGGPACLRLRVVLTKEEQENISANCLVTDELIHQVETIVKKYYRDRLSPSDLADPSLLTESRTALDELSQLLQLGSIYDFQRP
ncbi:MAG: N-succinylarginine dihydrolase [bacterium]